MPEVSARVSLLVLNLLCKAGTLSFYLTRLYRFRNIIYNGMSSWSQNKLMVGLVLRNSKLLLEIQALCFLFGLIFQLAQDWAPPL